MPNAKIQGIPGEQDGGGSWLDRFQEFWCRFQHDALMWPIHGAYECRICHRRYGIAWDSRAAVMPKPRARLIEISVPAASQGAPLHGFPKLVS
jgi:hypothetical protein